MAKVWNSKHMSWSRAIKVLPKDNLTTEGGIRAMRAKKFIPSYERDNSPQSMALILCGEYARIWVSERNQFIRQRKTASRLKHINNDFNWWLDKHRTKKKFCCI